MKQFLFLFIILASARLQGQNLSFVPRLNALKTKEQAIYNSKGGIGVGGSLRVSVFPWLYVQGGYNYNFMKYDDSRVRRANMRMWDCQLGFIPYQKIPIHLYFGTFMHKYNIRTNAVIVQNIVFFPEYLNPSKFDGWNVGIGYSLNKWLELKLTYETEPFYRFKYPYTSNFLRFEINGVIPFFKWGKAKMPVESAQ